MATKKTGAAAAGEKKAAAKRPAAKKTAAEKPAAKRPAAKKPAARKIPEKPRILLVAGECNPFSQTGGLGEVASSLPIAVNELGTAEMAVVTPLYECVGEQYRKDFQFICHINVPVAWRSQYAGLFKYIYRGVTYYFIDNEYYFKRGGLYGYYDDAERFAFFCRAVLELMPYMDFKPDVIHANDWHTALVPIYYKLYYMYAEGDAYSYIQNLFTIHNIEYQGRYDGNLLEEVFGIAGNQYFTLEWGGCVNLMFGAMAYCDRISTVSRTYAEELRSPEHACGLQDAVRRFEGKMTGIVNGIDTVVYNPATALALFEHYDATCPEKKVLNKTGLQKLLGLPEREDVPMITMVSRLAWHKGLDILKQAMTRIVKEDVQFVLLGTGEPEYEGFFRDLERAYPDKVRAIIAFNKDMSQKLFAAGDIYMMPSHSEPCGLGQMMAMRYGTVPIVRNVGGLNDTVHEGEDGNGFVCPVHTGEALAETTLRALAAYRDKPRWQAIMQRGMTEDWSWTASAKKYIELYKEMIANAK